MTDPLADLAGMRARAVGQPLAQLRIARLLARAERYDEMIDQCDALIAGDDANVAASAQRLMLRQVPDWHFSILHDVPRNNAYAEAIARALRARPGARVLEIGTGSGLLAMHAARAGAGAVVTCEANRLVAQAARGVLVANGFHDRVQLIEEHSSDLTAVDIGGRADILVSEIIADDVLSEDVLPSHEHALRALCTPDVLVIPARAAVRGALVCDHAPMRAPLDHVDGFDLAPFNRLRSPMASIAVPDRDLQRRSDATDLFDFNLADPVRHAPARRRLTLISGGGRIDGVLQWLRLDLSAGLHYENEPGGAWSNWGLRLHRFDEPIETVAGQPVTIDAAHDRRHLSITIA